MKIDGAGRKNKSEMKTSKTSIDNKAIVGRNKLNGKVDIDDRRVVGENTNKKERGAKSNQNLKKGNRIRKVERISNIPEPELALSRMSASRVVLMVLAGIISCMVISLLAYRVYYNEIRYPVAEVRDIESSGLGALNRWTTAIQTVDNDEISEITGSDSYIAKEIEYANGNEDRVEFIKRVVGTVSYVPDTVGALNKYGNPLLDKEDNLLEVESLVNSLEEEVTLNYIDYSKISLDKEKIKEIMDNLDVTPEDVDYSNRLVSVFCRYISELEEIPVKSERRIPSMIKTKEGYSVTGDEDIYLDKVLFSSEELYDFMVEFSLIASGGSTNPEWEKWNELSDEEKKKTKEPSKVLDKLQPTQEWSDWNNKDNKTDEDIEPSKYDAKKIMNRLWCGSYYLLNENSENTEDGKVVVKPISADVGDGTFKNPAGMNTEILTVVFVDEEVDGEIQRVTKPIKVKLVDYRVSQDALDYFETKDERNRGFDIKSEIQYVSYSFEVTNLSDEVLTISDDSSLSDDLANMSSRTGKVFGLIDEVVLDPDETKVIESWSNSTELNTKYLVWGKNFKREAPVVWFRVLAGNIDDPSEDKGVALNRSRYNQEQFVETSEFEE